jgi:uncharacterized membrane protein YqhA
VAHTGACWALKDNSSIQLFCQGINDARAGKEVIVSILSSSISRSWQNPILIVTFTGYQDVIRTIDLQERPDWPQGIFEGNFGGLTLKLLGSIVAIAAVEGLEWFFRLDLLPTTAKNVSSLEGSLLDNSRGISAIRA